MKATAWRRLGAMSSTMVSAMRLLTIGSATIALAQCAAVPAENGAQPPPPANYGKLISDSLKTFKNFATYTDFQISELRWVQAPSGWNWLACVRYSDRGRRMFYVFFISDNAIVKARYDVRTDQCPEQQYVPFDANSGTIGLPGATARSPLY